jgi:hypothetical protein
MTRYEIYSLEGMAAEYRETCESTADSNRAIRNYEPGAHQLAVSGSKVSVIGWASGTTGDQRAIVTRAISARTHAVFAARTEDGSHVEDAEDDTEQPAEPKRAKSKEAKAAKASAKASVKSTKRAQRDEQPRSSARTFEWNGESLTVRQWAERWGVHVVSVNVRLRRGEEFADIADHYAAKAKGERKSAAKPRRATTKPKAARRAKRAPAPIPPHQFKGEMTLLLDAIAEWGSLAELLNAANKWRAVREMTAL